MSAHAPQGPALVDYAKSLDCIHCGLCLNHCPTYRLRGEESSSPRGRIHLMRAVAEGALAPQEAGYVAEMDFCLLCRGCESVCPSGVQFGALMESARAGLAARRPWRARLARRLGFGLLAHPRLLELCAFAGRFAQRTGLLRLVAPLLGARGRALAESPPIPSARARRALPAAREANAPRRGAVALLEGCVARLLQPEVNRAAARVLREVGLEVHVPLQRPCCGSLAAHDGELELARRQARDAIASFDLRGDERGEPLPIVVTSAGCGSHMKEYGALLADDPLWAERARRFAARVRDFSELLAEPAARERLRAALARAPRVARGETGSSPLRVAWDDPCHLCHAQQIRAQPRELLALVPGLERVELAQSELCCGSAGIWALRRPDEARELLAPKLAELAASGASALVTANPGCLLQWQAGVARERLPLRVVHLAQVLDEALGGARGDEASAASR